MFLSSIVLEVLDEGYVQVVVKAKEVREMERRKFQGTRERLREFK